LEAYPLSVVHSPSRSGVDNFVSRLKKRLGALVSREVADEACGKLPKLEDTDRGAMLDARDVVREFLEHIKPAPTQDDILEAIAAFYGCRDWNTLSARLDKNVSRFVVSSACLPLVICHQLSSCLDSQMFFDTNEDLDNVGSSLSFPLIAGEGLLAVCLHAVEQASKEFPTQILEVSKVTKGERCEVAGRYLGAKRLDLKEQRHVDFGLQAVPPEVSAKNIASSVSRLRDLLVDARVSLFDGARLHAFRARNLKAQRVRLVRPYPVIDVSGDASLASDAVRAALVAIGSPAAKTAAGKLPPSALLGNTREDPAR
jgi:hypothetical protein